MLMARPVKEFMTSELITVTEDTPLNKVKNIFDSNQIHHIPVVDVDRMLKGIISKSDFLLLLDWGTRLGLPSSQTKNQLLLQSNIASDLMEKNVVVVKETDTLGKCVDIFKENYFRCIPVVDSEKKLSGIITMYDLMLIAYSPGHQLH